MKKRYILAAALLAVAFAPGCATRRQVQELSLEVRAVRQDLYVIKSENARLDSLFRSNIDQSRKLNADFAAYVSRLDDRMQMVEARLEDAVTLINRASGAIESRNSAQTARSLGSDTSSADTTGTPGQMDCEKVYKAAYYDFVKESYDLAVSGFQNYLKNCSKTALADNAQYWIGECYYLQKKYELAQKEFETMISQYPSSERIRAARLKLGKALYNQRFKTKAKSYFEDIIKEFPGTDEAQEAAQMLERYK